MFLTCIAKQLSRKIIPMDIPAAEYEMNVRERFRKPGNKARERRQAFPRYARVTRALMNLTQRTLSPVNAPLFDFAI